MNNQDLVESFSGIRGIYGQSINEELAYKYATAYCLLFCNENSS
jgi:phosphomannomutase